ncbi:hypothetical protein [Brevundimonas sp.]|uniref:hypothetical protein n=1 Tax=Brevundimonas sp. TaxID=1871086 RepID=UPI002FCB45EE
MSKLPITVDLAFYEAIARATSEPFADSYLHGATLEDGKLLPRTQTAWSRLDSSWAAKGAMRRMGVVLLKPPPFIAAAAPASERAG